MQSAETSANPSGVNQLSFNQQLFVASFGVIPFYVSPFVLVVLANDLAMPMSVIGGFPASIMAGQFFAALALGNVSSGFSLNVLARCSFAVSIAALVWASFVPLDVFKLLILGSLLGVSSGVLMFFGTYVSVTAQDKLKAFAVRLGYSLINVGVIISLFTVLFAFLNLRGLFLLLALTYLYLLFRFPELKVPASERKPETVLRPQAIALPLAGFALLLFFFVGQTGFYSFHAAFEFDAIGLPLLFLSAPRIVAGVLLVVFNTRLIKSGQTRGLLVWGVIEVLCILALSGSISPFLIFGVIVLYEISLNILATHVQGKVAQQYPQLAISFLAPTVMMGAIIGPMSFGALIGLDFHGLAIAAAILACAIPSLMRAVWRAGA